MNVEMINYKLQKYTEIKGFNINEFLEKVMLRGEFRDKEMASLLNVDIPFVIVKDNVIGYIENPASSI
jgi:hypothetical protein